MELSASKTRSFTQPKPIADLMAELDGTLFKNEVTITAKKQPRNNIALMRTAEKEYRPLTLAEMKTQISGLKFGSPRRFDQVVPSEKKKLWNSSVKVDAKKISNIANGKLKNSSVRKALQFQPKPNAISSAKMTVQTIETPKFPKPRTLGTRKPVMPAKPSIRISGISNIIETPAQTIKSNRSRTAISNKENNPYSTSATKITPSRQKKFIPPKTNTPLLNSSWKSGSDASFLQKEKEIHEVENKFKTILEEKTENIAEISPPVSTPFKEYRSVQEYFNNSSCVENSTMCNDDTIMCFDKHSPSKESLDKKKLEESMVTLCDLFTKTSVANPQCSAELTSLLEEEKNLVDHINTLKNGIVTLTTIQKAQEKLLVNIRKLIDEKKTEKENREIGKNQTVGDKTGTDKNKNNTISPEKSPILSRPCSVIKSSRSPSYKIPTKKHCFRKNGICKSMPNVSTGNQTPVKNMEGRALCAYMKIKQQMNFLSTPMINRNLCEPDTPALTSHNLQKQLDKLYDS